MKDYVNNLKARLILLKTKEFKKHSNLVLDGPNDEF